MKIFVGIVAGMVIASYLLFTGCSSNKSAESIAPPRALKASPGFSKVYLQWSSASNADTYRVYMSEKEAGPFTAVALSQATNFKIDGLQNGTPYFFSVSTLNGSTESAKSIQVKMAPDLVLLSPYTPSSAVYKGQLHAHTTNSDGKQSPETVAAAYKQAGYGFMAITDHNVMTSIPPLADFLLINGVEQTVYHEFGHEAHIITVNPPSASTSFSGQEVIDAAVNNGGLAILAHPNYVSAFYTIDDMKAVINYSAIEVHNNVVDYVQGKGNSESKWDELLSTSGLQIFGVASDDMHQVDINGFNKAWVNVFSDHLTQQEIIANLRKGNFYASTGPNLSITISGHNLAIATDVDASIEFIGLNGSILSRAEHVRAASYEISGNEGYVRVRVTSDADGKKAWTNPVMIH